MTFANAQLRAAGSEGLALIYDDTAGVIGADIKFDKNGAESSINGTLSWVASNSVILNPTSFNPLLDQVSFTAFQHRVHLVQTSQKTCEMCNASMVPSDIIKQCYLENAYCKSVSEETCEDTPTQITNASTGLMVGAALATILGVGVTRDTFSGSIEKNVTTPKQNEASWQNKKDLQPDSIEADEFGEQNDDEDDDIEDAIEDLKDQAEEVAKLQTGFHLLAW